MDVLYYSNSCKYCQKLLAHLAKIGVLEKYNFICIDRRTIDQQTNQIYIILDRGVKTTLPPNVSRVPTILRVNQNFTAIVGDEIYTYVDSQVKPDVNNIAVQNGGEPIGYILSPSSGGVNIISETYTMYNAPPEELSAKGIGNARQMHNYVSVTTDNGSSIYTPTDELGGKPDIGSNAPIQKKYSVDIEGISRPLMPASNSLPTNATTYNAYSVPGVLYNTGQLIVPELQRPPAHRHSKLGEDVTVDSLQQKRNIDLQSSLPFIAKQLNQIISPEISELRPPERYYSPVNGSQNGGYKLNPRDSQNILYGNGNGNRQSYQSNENCYI
jgi:hypothetical protein